MMAFPGFTVMILCVLAMSILISCGSPYADYEHKLDPLLRQKLAKLEKADSQEEVGLIVRWSGSVTDEDRSLIGESGVRVMTVAGDIVTATGTWRQVKELSTKSSVVSIELAVERNFNH